MRNLKLSLIAILIIGLVSSCKKDDDNSDVDEVILNPNTVIIDSIKGSELTDYDSTKIGFNQGASITNEIKIGSIVVSGPQQLAPDGFLRRILSIDTVSGRVIYATEHAKITDALEQAEFNVTATFDPSEVIALDSGVTITALKKEAATFQYLVQVELKDNANNAFTVDLTVNLDPSFELETRIRGGLYVSAILNMNGDWEIKGTASTQLGPFQFRKPLFRPRNIARQTVWIPTPLAGIPFPVVINEDFVVYLVGQVSIDGSVTIGVTAEFESSLGVEYTDGSFNKIVQFNAGTPQPSVSAQVSAEGRLGVWPVVIVSAYDQHFGKIEIGPEGYLEASVFLSTGSQSCKLDYGVDLNISFAAPIFTDNTWDPTLPPIYGPTTLLSNFCAGNPCAGFSISTTVNGTSITANPSGGTSPYTYSWTNGETTKTISGLSNGTYTVTATDDEGCTASAQGTVSPPCANPPSVNGTVSGSDISITATGGAGSYTYSWTGPNGFTSTQKNLTGLANGNYTVVVTDGAGCTASGSWTIGVDPCIANPLTISITVTDDDISLSHSGTSPYDYSWSGPNGFTSTSRNLSGLDPGTYCVTVTDANQCTATDCGTVDSQFPMIVYNSGNINQYVRDASSTSGNIITSVAPGKKFVAKSESNGWYLIDIPSDGVGSPQQGYARKASGEMQPTSGSCVLVTGTNLRIRDSAGGNIMWIYPTSTGNYEHVYTDIDQHFVYTSTTTSGSYTWYRIDLPNFCYGSSGSTASVTTGWISGEFSEVDNCY